MKASAVIALFQRMLDEKWRYRWGAAEEGCVDCAGAFVYALQQNGQRIYHGSNRMARTEVVALLPISAAAPGMLAFKRKKPGDSGYQLPAEYQEGASRFTGDLYDYYHVGLVDRDPRYVLNAQSTKTGFVRSRITENWACVAYAKKIEYGEDESMEGIPGRVKALTGETVNLRAAPKLDGALLKKVPVGEDVTVLDAQDGWCYVQCGKRTGYMMAQYIETSKQQQGGAEAPLSGGNAPLTGERAKAYQYIMEAQRALEAALIALEGVQV